jgi:hypothetical protein
MIHHRCPAPCCYEWLPRELLVCRLHWYLLPPEQRQAILDGGRDRSAAWPAGWLSLQQAIDAARVLDL